MAFAARTIEAFGNQSSPTRPTTTATIRAAGRTANCLQVCAVQRRTQRCELNYFSVWSRKFRNLTWFLFLLSLFLLLTFSFLLFSLFPRPSTLTKCHILSQRNKGLRWQRRRPLDYKTEQSLLLCSVGHFVWMQMKWDIPQNACAIATECSSSSNISNISPLDHCCWSIKIVKLTGNANCKKRDSNVALWGLTHLL